MSHVHDAPARVIVPSPRPARTIGILNIVFGGLILAMNVLSLVMIMIMPYWVRIMQAQEDQFKAVAAREREVKVEELKKAVEAEKDPARKKTMEEEVAAVEKRPLMPGPPMTMSMDVMNTPAYRTYVWGDVFTSVPLNVAMILAGVGLLKLRESGRLLSLWVAGLKIVRIVVLTSFLVGVLTPAMAKPMGERMDQFMADAMASQGKAGAGGPPPGTFARIFGITYAVSFAAWGVVSLIYPGVSLWVLTRPRVWAACNSKPQTEPELS